MRKPRKPDPLAVHMARQRALEYENPPSDLDAAAGRVLRVMRGMCIGGMTPTTDRAFLDLAAALGLLVHAGARPAIP